MLSLEVMTSDRLYTCVKKTPSSDSLCNLYSVQGSDTGFSMVVKYP
jgi:hypothetical protein